MTIYLRTKENKTVVDIELSKFGIFINDLSVVINIKEYSTLLCMNLRRRDKVIKEFSELSELRGWFHEVYLENGGSPNLNEFKKEIKELFLTPIQEKYNLYYVED